MQLFAYIKILLKSLKALFNKIKRENMIRKEIKVFTKFKEYS